jgi:hypothetical protein
MKRPHPPLLRPALVGLFAALPLTQAAPGQTPPPGMVAVPSFDSVPVPSTDTGRKAPGHQAGEPSYPQPYPQAYPQQEPTYPGGLPNGPTYPQPTPSYPQPSPGSGDAPPTYPGAYPAGGSSQTDCGPDPTAECAARSIGQAVAGLAETLRGMRFDAQRARSTPCPSDSSAVWSNCFAQLTLDSGAIYEGTFFTDQRHGTGTYRFPDGEIYSGEFRNNQPNGRGETRLTNGDRYVGDFREGHATGRGSYVFAEGGSRFVGDFRDMKANGKGVLYLGDGEIVASGEWKDDNIVREAPLDPRSYAFTRDFGMVEVPGGTPSRTSGPVPPASQRAPDKRTTPSPSSVRQPSARSEPAPGQSACTPGPALEPIDYASPEYIGLPEGRRARMCFYRSEGSTTAQLKFFPGGIFRMSSQTGSGGFAMSGGVYQAERGVYGLTDRGQLNLRIAYSGTGVAQTTQGAGSSTSLDVSGADRLDRELTLPNCQKITIRDEARRAALGPARGRGHPDYLVLDGVRWEQDTDCGDWEGWK